MTRDKLQKQAADMLLKKRRLVCQWATGTGKSGIVLTFLKEHPTFSCLIFVPESNNIQNWIDEFEKFGIQTDKVKIACYASMQKFKRTYWDLLVFDEAPHINTQKRLDVCKTMYGEYVLALGAVMKEEEVRALESEYGEFARDSLPITKAMKLGLLPYPEICVCHLDIGKIQGKHYYRGQAYSPKAYLELLNIQIRQQYQKYCSERNDKYLTQMKILGSKRKLFLGEIKETALSHICTNLQNNNRRFLCFCSSIAQAEILGGENAFTSKTAASKKLLQKFNNHDINSLYVVGKLIEGQNLKDIECGVIGLLGNSIRIAVQELGRIMRSKNPRIYVLVFDNTKDTSFLTSITSQIPETYIKHYRL